MKRYFEGLRVRVIFGILLAVTAPIGIAGPFILTPVGPLRTDGFHIATGLKDASGVGDLVLLRGVLGINRDGTKL